MSSSDRRARRPGGTVRVEPVDRGTSTTVSAPPTRIEGPGVGEVLRAPDGSLIVLRAFLGVTFVFAGLQKLANPNFFRASAPGSFEEQLRGSIATSPLHHLLAPVLHVATLVAVLISLGEIAVGLGTLLGLFGRIAALGGALLSLSFFLTVSFNDSPYYYGADIVFLFAWTPFVIGGPGALSLDEVFARRAAAERAALSAMPHAGRAVQRRAEELDRRIFLQRTTAAGVVGLGALVLGGVVAALGQIFSSSPSPSGTTAFGGTGTGTTTAPAATNTTVSGGTAATNPVPQGTRIGPSGDVPVGGAASFTDATLGVPAFVVQPTQGTFRAFSAVCPHAGCQVVFDQQNEVFACPCHGSIFNGATGAVEQGPAASGLSPIPVTLESNDELYVTG